MESKSKTGAFLRNPYAGREGYNCFGCSPHNHIGLRMKFEKEGDTITSLWDPSPDYQGWKDILHGGIQATLMDEIASWFLSVIVGKGGVTSRLDIRYRKPVPVRSGAIKLVARLEEMKRSIAVIHVSLFSSDGELCTEGLISYFSFPDERAESQLDYPGPDAFLP